MITNPKARLGCCPEGSCVDEAVIRAPLDAEIERLSVDVVGALAREETLRNERDAAIAMIGPLRALLLKAYQFISPHSDPMGVSNTEMAAQIMRALEQKATD